MECKWSQAPLGELISYISKGIVPKYTDDIVGSTMVLGQRCVRNQRVDYTQARFHDQKTKPFKPEKTVVLGDILINATGVGSAGRVAQVTVSPQQDCVTDGHVITLRAKGINPFYLGYFLKSRQPMIEQMAEGSTGQTEMNRSRLQNEIVVTFPQDNAVQTAIAQFGLSIDRKIAINNQINGYLEELLLTRYDDFFGPFDSSTCDGKLADIGEVIGGATPSKKRADYYSRDGIGWITPRDLSNTNNKFITHGANDITQAGYDSCSARLLCKGSVLFSSRAPIGYVAIADDELVTNQGFKSVVPKPEVGTAFVYCFLKRNARRIADMGAGTTFPEVSGKMMKAVELKLPELETCELFSAFANPLLCMQRKCEAENAELESLRDALLPKLMSGEIDVSKVNLTQLNSHLSGC